jgi:hypothetical protein
LHSIVGSTPLRKLKALIRKEITVKFRVGSNSLKALGIDPAGALARELTTGSRSHYVDLKEDSITRDMVSTTITRFTS